MKGALLKEEIRLCPLWLVILSETPFNCDTVGHER